MPRLMVWRELVETTRPGDQYRTYNPGPRHAAVVVRVPAWAAWWLRRVLPVETALEAARPRERAAVA